MKTSSKIIIAFAILSAIFGSFLAIEQGYFRLQEVQVKFSGIESNKVIFNKIKSNLLPYTSSLVGKNVWDVGLNRVIASVLEDKRVAHVSVRRKFPNKMELTIEPQKPIALVLDEKNRAFPMATDASLLPQLKVGDDLDLPILRGKQIISDKKLREDSLEIFALFDKEGRLSDQKVSEVVFDKKHGWMMFLSEKGTHVKLGRKNFADKVSKVIRVLQYLQNNKMNTRVIDARFSKKVVVRPRNGT